MSGAPPFSRPVRVDALPRDGLVETVEAGAAERAALAKLNAVPQIASLSATFRLKRGAGGVVRVSGEVRADLTQVCVVSLEPFPATVAEAVDVRFAPPPRDEPQAARRGAPVEAEMFSLDDEDEPDPIVDGRIDLGALAAEFFALGLDPYPRKPGVAFDAPPDEEALATSALEEALKRAKGEKE